MAEIRICTLCERSLPSSAYSQRQWTKKNPKCQTCMPDTNRHYLTAFGELRTGSQYFCRECREILPRDAFGRSLHACRSCNREINERLRQQKARIQRNMEKFDV